MKVRLKKFRKPIQTTLVAQLPNGKLLGFNKLGAVSPDLPEAHAYKIIGDYPDMLEPYVEKKPAPAKKAPTKVTKVVKAPANK